MPKSPRQTRIAQFEGLSPILTERRTARTLMYLALIVAGVVVFYLPIAFFDNVLTFTAVVVGVFLIIGGLVSKIGHTFGIVTLERAGYPLILAAMTGLTTVLFLEAHNNTARTFIGLITLSFTLGLYGRWRDLGTLRKLRLTLAVEYTDHEPH